MILPSTTNCSGALRIPAAIFLFLLAMSTACQLKTASRKDTIPNTEEIILEHDGLKRESLVYLPTSYDGKTPLPLVLAFHGGGGNNDQYLKFTRLNAVAEEENFIAVFPQGIDGHWYDDRFAAGFIDQEPERDDVGFTLFLLEKIKKTYAVDENKIYATGMSNGGIFCQQLAIEAADHFTAVASITAQIAVTSAELTPQDKISVLLMNGTADPLVPYQGGPIVVTLSNRRREEGKVETRGSVLSTDDTISYWLHHNDLTGAPDSRAIPDKDLNDGATAVIQTWSDGEISVVLYRIDQGGHTYPGAHQYLPRSVIGATCRDFDASRAIWDFFSQHSR